MSGEGGEGGGSPAERVVTGQSHSKGEVMDGRSVETRVSSAPRGASSLRLLAVLVVSLLALSVAACGFESADTKSSPSSKPRGEDAAARTGQDPRGAGEPLEGQARFDPSFEHGTADVNGVRMHYVTNGEAGGEAGGEGPPLVLLHGWPQTWYEWAEVMPALAEEHTVIAVDLPGLGDSEGEPPSYDKRTLARYVHGLVSEELGYDSINLGAHDLGAGVGYQYAAQYPDEVREYAHMDYPLPGPAIDAAQYEDLSWHIALHRQEGLPEALTEGREREYLERFYPQVAAAPDSIPEEAVGEYARTYSQPGKMSAGFELYRTLDEDTEDNIESAKKPLEMPVLVMSGTAGPYEGTDAGKFTAGTVRAVASDVSSVGVPDAGHYLPEENPEFVADELLRFFSEDG